MTAPVRAGAGGRGPLGGATVVVTRPRAGDAEPGSPGRDRLAEALAEAGGVVLAVPAIAIVGPADGGRALEAALAHLGDHRWVVFTSRHAVEQVVARLGDARALEGVQVAAVGAATAAALGAHGVVADLVPARASAGGLVAEFPEPAAAGPGTPRGGGRVLFPAADRARPTLPAGLRAMGWDVDEVVAYRTVAAPPPPAAVLGAVASADAITFSSPSAVHAYVSMRTPSGEALPVPPLVACAGPVTAAAARDAGLAVDVEAPAGDPRALVASLAARLGRAAAPS